MEGKIRGVFICESAPTITHLSFADDSLLLLKVDDENATCLQQVLQLYEDCSGQIINKEKSSVLFSKNTQENMKDAFLTSLGVLILINIWGCRSIWADQKRRCSVI